MALLAGSGPGDLSLYTELCRVGNAGRPPQTNIEQCGAVTARDERVSAGGRMGMECRPTQPPNETVTSASCNNERVMERAVERDERVRVGIIMHMSVAA